MKIIVGSTNPVKIEAIKLASKGVPNCEIVGVDVESGVSSQPRTDEETKKGSIQRAKKALETDKTADLGIGLEGGVTPIDGHLWNTVWCAVVDRDGHVTVANGERFALPKKLADVIDGGKEMGPAMDELTGVADIKKKQGMIGVVTNGYITRTQMYAGLAHLAIGLWIGREWGDGNFGK